MASNPPIKASRVIASSPIYYGWVILLAGTFGLIMTLPGQTAGVAVFLDAMIADLGLSRSAVSLMYTLGTLAGALTLPFVGRWIDRHGPRYVVVVAALFSLACVWMGYVTGLVTLFIGFTLIHGLGQGSLGLVSMHVVNIWFVRRRGLAVGLAGIGMALAMAVFPPLIEALLSSYGWRQAYVMLGGVVALAMVPVGALFFRERPEHFGLTPDSGSIAAPLDEAAYTLAEAQRTLTFWLFSAGSFSVAALGTGLIFHHFSIMAMSGLERTVAAAFFIPFGFVAAGANLTTGILMDRVPPRFLLVVMLSLLALSLLVATRVGSLELVYAYGALFGLMQGMQGAIMASVYAYYFGRSHLGAIKGFATTLSVAGTAFGPLLFAVGLERSGDYGPVLALSALLPLGIAVLALFSKPPRR